jgi:hypothetical protein
MHTYDISIDHTQQVDRPAQEFSSVMRVEVQRKGDGQVHDLTEVYDLPSAISIIRVDVGCYPSGSSQVVFLTTDYTDAPVRRWSFLLSEPSKEFPELTVYVDDTEVYLGPNFRGLE